MKAKKLKLIQPWTVADKAETSYTKEFLLGLTDKRAGAVATD